MLSSVQKPFIQGRSSNIEADYQRFVLCVRNLPGTYSVETVEMLMKYMTSSENNRGRVAIGLGLRNKSEKNWVNVNWDSLDTNNEQTMMIFWALFFSTVSKTQKLKILWMWLEHNEIGELLRENFGKHLRKILLNLANTYSVEEVRQHLKNEVVILNDSQWKPVIVSLYPLNIAQPHIPIILSNEVATHNSSSDT